LLSFYGLQSAKAAKAGVLINGLLPVFGAFWALVWLRTKLKLQQTIGICIVIFANGLMLYGSNFTISNTTQLWGVIFLVLASMVYSTYMAGIKAWAFTFKDVIVQVPLINTLILLPIWLYVPSHIDQASWTDISMQIVYQGIIVTLGAGIMITYAIGKLGAVTSSLFIAFVPVVTALIAFTFMGESLNAIEWLSIVLCTSGILVYTKA
jgi:drug/metabolite transporter (DMT)-like permease